MRVIIAGSRYADWPWSVIGEIVERSGFVVEEVVCGMASGVDGLALRWAEENNIPVREFRADWDRHGRKAGPMRNAQMVDYADALIAVPAGMSPGTQSTIRLAKKRGIPVYVEDARGPLDVSLSDDDDAEEVEI